MTSPSPAPPEAPAPTVEEYSPLFNGMPMVVRLLTGDVYCIGYRSNRLLDRQLIMERPLIMRPVQLGPTVNPTTPDNDDADDDDNDDVVETSKPVTTAYRVPVRFARWMSTSDAGVFGVDMAQVITLAPLSDEYINAYMEWAQMFYASAEASPSEPPTPNTTSLYNFILQQYTPVGKPH